MFYTYIVNLYRVCLAKKILDTTVSEVVLSFGVGLFEIVCSRANMLLAQRVFHGGGGATHIAYEFHN